MRIFFVCFLLISMMSIYSEGVMPEGEGTIESPFLIETLDNLRYISENSEMWGGYRYLQTADIDASPTQNWNSGLGFIPLGEAHIVDVWDGPSDSHQEIYSTPFNSHYDGGDYSISNLYINDSNYSYFIGFVAYQTNGSLKNINLINVDITGCYYVGGLVAGTKDYVTNCSVTGSVNGETRCGGIAGSSDQAIIVNSQFTGTVTASWSVASLLVSECENTEIRNCDVAGSVTASYSAFGLVGFIDSDVSIEDCSVDADISVTNMSSGIFDVNHNGYGLLNSNYINVKNTFYNYNSSLNNSSQKLFGKLTDTEFQQWIANGKTFDPQDYFQISNDKYVISSEEEFMNLRFFYNRNDLEFTLSNNLAFPTELSSVIPMFNSHFDGNGHTLSGLTIYSNKNNIGLFGILEINGVIENLFIDEFDISGNDRVACLVGFSKGKVLDCEVDGIVDGENSCGLIVGYSVFESEVADCTSYGEITGNDHIGGIVGESMLSSQYSINACTSYATIVGHDAIGGIIGRYGYCNDCLFDGNITGNDYVGGIIGKSFGMYSDSQVTNSESHGVIIGDDGVGGIAGISEITDCFSDATITGNENVGGLLGKTSVAQSSYFTGTVTGVTNVGGIAGTILTSASSEISRSFSLGVVKGYENVGGVVGFVDRGSSSYRSFIENCYSKGIISSYSGSSDSYENIGGIVGNADNAYISNCYTTSMIDLSGSNVGGFSGLVADNISTHDSFWSSELAGQENSASGTNVTTTQLQTQATFTDAGWDFDSIWYLSADQNDGYPLLRDVFYTENVDDEMSQDVEIATCMKSAYPNPFNPETTIEFYVNKNDTASLTIYNLKGQVVKQYPSFIPGEHKVVWNGKNNENKQVSSGLYLYRLEGTYTSITKKMVLMK